MGRTPSSTRQTSRPAQPATDTKPQPGSPTAPPADDAQLAGVTRQPATPAQPATPPVPVGALFGLGAMLAAAQQAAANAQPATPAAQPASTVVPPRPQAATGTKPARQSGPMGVPLTVAGRMSTDGTWQGLVLAFRPIHGDARNAQTPMTCWLDGLAGLDVPPGTKITTHHSNSGKAPTGTWTVLPQPYPEGAYGVRRLTVDAAGYARWFLLPATADRPAETPAARAAALQAAQPATDAETPSQPATDAPTDAQPATADAPSAS